MKQRADDSELAINRRLDLYEKETKPLLSFYEDRDLLVEVDGQGATDEVFERVQQIVDSKI